jgi:hypothetical protein
MSVSYGGDSIVFADGSVQSGGWTGMKNRIINGAMQIDQRNAGASITPAQNAYTIDRWRFPASQASKLTLQQNAGSVTPPTGFKNYLGLTSTSSYSLLVGDYFGINQFVEANNTADLDWGTANAKTITLSFWVRSSLTGTFGGAIRTGDNSNYSYPFSYTINSANTWEYETITISGPTAGTWGTGTAVGLDVWFSLGTGATFSGTAGAWAAANYVAPTGGTSVVGTNGATFYITGVQLERGSTASSFEYRPYTTELQLCQRYYYRVTSAGTSRIFGNGYVNSSTISDCTLPFPVTMRDEPSALEQTGTASNYVVIAGAGNVTCSSVPTYLTSSQWGAQFRLTVASGLTSGQATLVRGAVAGTYLGWSAEL